MQITPVVKVTGFESQTSYTISSPLKRSGRGFLFWQKKGGGGGRRVTESTPTPAPQVNLMYIIRLAAAVSKNNHLFCFARKTFFPEKR